MPPASNTRSTRAPRCKQHPRYAYAPASNTCTARVPRCKQHPRYAHAPASNTCTTRVPPCKQHPWYEHAPASNTHCSHHAALQAAPAHPRYAHAPPASNTHCSHHAALQATPAEHACFLQATPTVCTTPGSKQPQLCPPMLPCCSPQGPVSHKPKVSLKLKFSLKASRRGARSATVAPPATTRPYLACQLLDSACPPHVPPRTRLQPGLTAPPAPPYTHAPQHHTWPASSTTAPSQNSRATPMALFSSSTSPRALKYSRSCSSVAVKVWCAGVGPVAGALLSSCRSFKGIKVLNVLQRCRGKGVVWRCGTRGGCVAELIQVPQGHPRIHGPAAVPREESVEVWDP
eukprot:364782-Chlamydomonas_euryale.AAC.9